ncbi:hypothetical protein ACTXT7_010651 [Hymenolepis weldensis]
MERVLATATPVEVVTDDMKLYSSVRDSAKEKILTHSMKSSMPEIDPTTTAITISPKTLIKSLKCLGRYNHIRVKPMLVRSTKRLVLVDEKCKEHEKIVHADSEAALTSTQDPICSQTNVLWSLSDLTLSGPNPEMSCQFLIGEKTVEENRNSTCLVIGRLLMLMSKFGCNIGNIYVFDTHPYLPIRKRERWRSTPTYVISALKCKNSGDSAHSSAGCFRGPRKIFKMDPTFKRMDKMD